MSSFIHQLRSEIPHRPRFSRSLPYLPLALAVAITLSGGALSTVHAEENSSHADGVAFFERKVRPVLVNRCYQCHSADTKAAGGLRVDDRNGLLLGGDGGAAVVPGHPEKSLLLERVQHENPKRRMPKEGELLTATEIEDVTAWIKNGAAWPHEQIPASIGQTKPRFEELKRTHWAWQPLTNPAVPSVTNAAWPKATLDRFVLAQLEVKQLPPVPDADPATLLRRVTYDLTGLPPTPAELAAFAQDSSPEALAKVVDRLLASPRFGERWGRHWLDVARYGESTGPSRNIPYPHAWKYRDYVIDAVNRDLPYDRFIQEQIAGDLLPAATNEERDRLLTATGFLAIGVKDVNQRFKTRFIMDNVDEKIDAVTRSVLGLTVSCARCHDHKFDPIPVTDYYALAGIFTSTEDCAGVKNKMGGGGLDYYVPSALVRLASDVPPPPADQVKKLEAEVAEAKKAWDEIRGTPEGLKKAPDGRPTQRVYRVKYDKLQGDLLALTDPASRGAAVHGVREGSTIADTEVRIRGEAERLGPVVPRGFLTTFAVPDAAAVNPAQSGRLELARWLTSAQNPLASRVIVNRIWQHLFGAGLITTVDNFGVKGDVPSHPELLDYLASRFIQDGWSTKRLVREIVLSRAYQLGTDAPAQHREADPANRLIWRHSPRRLDAEEVRDAMLATAGRLQETAPGASATKSLKMIELRDNGPEARRVQESADRSLARSVYLPLLRGVIPKSLEAFDPVTQSLVTGQRDSTTVPTQALYLLNATFVRKQALELAEKISRRADLSDAQRVQELYTLTVGRPANEVELQRALDFVGAYATSYLEFSGPAASATVALLDTRTTDEGSAVTDAKSAEASATTGTAEPKTPIVIPDNPDDVSRTEETPAEESIEPQSAASAGWAALVQALYASAEFRFVR